MKFGKRFREEIVPEWKAMYMDYKGLKKRLRNVQRERLLMPNKQQKIRSSRVSVNSYNAQEDERTEYSSRYKRYSGQSQVTQITQITNVAGSVQDFFHKVSSALVSLQKQPPLQSDDILPPAQITSLNTLKEEVNPREVIFFSALDGELEKVEEFYKTKEDEASNRMELLMQSYEMLKERRDAMLKEMTGLSKNEKKRSVELWNTPKAIFKRSVDFFASQDTPSTLSMASQKDSDILSSPDELLKHFKIAKDNIKKAIFEFYRGTELLRKYRALNYSGFRKILKKYDKVSERNGSQIYMKKVISSHFVRSDTVKKLLKKAEDFYVNHFENGSRPQALRKLRMPNKKNKTYYPSTLRTGLYLGLTLPALIGSLVLGVNNQRYSLLELYSGIFLPIFLLLLLSIDMYVWTRSRINYKFIIELDLRDNLDFRQYMELPAITLLVMSSIMFVSFMEDFFANVLPWPAAIFIGAIILNPFPVFYYNARRWFIFSTMRLLGSGLLRVEFRDFFIADIFTSLSYSMISYQLFERSCRDHVICDIRTRLVTPVLGSIPALFRLLQCFKRYYDTSQKVHVINLCKYASIIVSVVMTYIYRTELGTEHEAIARIAWCLAQSIAAIYTFSWDVKVDWSLLQLRSVNYLLRDELGYEHHWLYYGAIIADLFLRFTWILFIYWPKERGISFCIALGEVIRRLIWVCFRIENEHIVNCREFRAVKELPLPFQSDILTGHASDDENIDYDRSTSFTSWSSWSKKIFTKDSRPRNNSLRGNDPADNWKDFEPRKNLVYPHQEIYEERESDDDSDYEEDIDDKHELTLRKKKSISISRMEEGYELSNAYASRSFYPVNE